MFEAHRNVDSKGLTEDELNQIMLKSVLPKYQRKVIKNKFLRKFEIRQSELEKLYNMYLNDVRLRVIFNDYIFNGKTVNSLIKKDMKQAVLWGECFIYFFSGLTGSGKSWACLDQGMKYPKIYMGAIDKPVKIRWFLDSEDYEKPSMIYKLGKDPKETVDLYLSYSNSNTNSIFQIAQDRSLIIQDESPMQHGKGSRISKDNLSNTIKVAARRNKLNLLIINPTIIKIENVNYYFRVLGKNRATRESLSLMFNSDLVPIGVIETKVNLPTKLTQQYEEFSKLRKSKLQTGSGMSGVTITEKELEKLAKLLLDATASKGIKKKKDFEQYSAMVPGVAGHMYQGLICTEAARMLNHGDYIPGSGKKEEKKEEKVKDLTDLISKEMSPEGFANYVKARLEKIPSHEIDFIDRKILHYWVDGLTFAEISQMGDIGLRPASIGKRMRKYREGKFDVSENLSNFKMGRIFEEYCAVSKGVPISDLAEYSSQPDLIIGNNIYTIKWEYDTNRSYYTYSIDFGPEKEEVKKNKNKVLRLLYYNMASNPRDILDINAKHKDYGKIVISLNNTFKLIKV